MRRPQIHIDDDLDRALGQVAIAEGRSAAAVVRQALRSYLGPLQRPQADDDPILRLAGALGGLPADAAVEHDRDRYGGGPALVLRSATATRA